MKKIAEKIVQGRYVVFAVFAILIVYCFFGFSKVNVEYDLTSYLDNKTDTKKAIDIMNEEFVTYPSSRIMIKNISYGDAENLYKKISDIDKVKDFTFENSEKYYKDNCALFSINFSDKDCERAYSEVLSVLGENEIYISSSPVQNYADTLSQEIMYALLLAIVVIIAVLILTSRSFAEVGVMLIVFAVSALLNMGTNFWFGKISFVSNSVCTILQLALAIDYAIILCHRFADEKQSGKEAKQAMADALSKAIPEIAGSSLTTIAGLVSLICMSFKLGADMGLVLAKSIICSLLTVFLLMPGITLLFSKAIDKTTHKSFMPKITPIGKFVVRYRKIIVPAFVVIVGVCCYLSFNVKYIYSTSSISTKRPSETMIAQAETQKVFGNSNTFAILVPKDDYDMQKQILETVGKEEIINSSVGIAGVEIPLNGKSIMLGDSLDSKELAELLGLDENLSKTVYRLYSIDKDIYVSDIGKFKIPFVDMLMYVSDNEEAVKGLLKDSPEKLEMLNRLLPVFKDACEQLVGKNYNRLVFNIDSGIESKETFDLIEKLNVEVKALCPEAVFAGNSMSSYDLNKSFSADMTKISVLTTVFVFAILLFTLRSLIMPVLLVLTIQGAIFINFARYAIMGKTLFFFIYLIVSAIQMGATIDYAIVMTNRYKASRVTLPAKEAAVKTLNDAFPTIITSGIIMSCAGFLIGLFVTDPLISGICVCLGFGVVISVCSVMLVLPAILVLCDKLIEKSQIKIPKIKNK